MRTEEHDAERARLVDDTVGGGVLIGIDGAYGRSKGGMVTASQNCRSFSTRFSGGFPAIRAAFMAPIEMPATQFG